MNDALRPGLLQLLRWRYAILGVLLVYWAGRKPVQGSDWGGFNVGAALLFRGEHPRIDGPGLLHLFATAPNLHMGPFSLIGAGAFKVLYPGDGRLGVTVFMCALGPLVVYSVEATALRRRGLRNALDEPLLALVTLVSGAAFLYSWADVTWTYGRLDEFMVICAAAVALWFVVNGQPLFAGAAVGLAIGSKSWGIFLLPILAALPWRQALRAGALALAVGVLVWLPFVLADAGTFDALRATELVGVDRASGPHLLGVDAGPVVPEWLRPVQVAVALGLAALAVARGRWAAALLLAVGARLALDPAVVSYYATALVFAAFVWDLFGSRRPLPIWGIATVIAFYGVPELTQQPHAHGAAMLGVVIAAIVVVLASPKRWLQPVLGAWSSR